MEQHESTTYVLRPLGTSLFNYEELHEARFVHYCRVCRLVLGAKGKRVLEIGPGDHLVTDFLRRKGLEVDTLDNDPALYPDFSRDIRKAWDLPRRYDIILAAEVFEHLPFDCLSHLSAQAARYLHEGGCLIVSLPFSTIRLFPKDKRYGKIQSPMGRLPLGIPLSSVRNLVTLFRGIYRFLVLRYTWKGSFRPFRFPTPHNPEDGSVHHWDTGYYPTTRAAVRRVFEKCFEIEHDESHTRDVNAYYLVMRRKDDHFSCDG